MGDDAARAPRGSCARAAMSPILSSAIPPAAFAPAVARAELAAARRRVLIAIFAVVTGVFQIAGLRASGWVYGVLALWMGLTFLSGVVLRRVRSARDADLVQAVSY